MKKKELNEYLDKGYLYVNILFEIVGNPKEHIEKAMKMVLDEIRKEKNIIFVKEDVGSAEDVGDGLWSVYAETDLLLDKLEKLSWISFNFLPATIEIKEPGKITLKDKQLNDFVNDLLSQLHQTNIKQVELNSNTQGLLRNINALMRNAILLSLGEGEKKTPDDIGIRIGVQGKDLEPVLEAMIKEGKLEKKGDKYSRKK
jgi:hypothetical protein